MSVCIVRAESTAGQMFELGRVYHDEAEARTAATWCARALGRFGDPGTWAGGKVVVVDASTRRLVSATRIIPRGVGVFVPPRSH